MISAAVSTAISSACVLSVSLAIAGVFYVVIVKYYSQPEDSSEEEGENRKVLNICEEHGAVKKVDQGVPPV